MARRFAVVWAGLLLAAAAVRGDEPPAALPVSPAAEPAPPVVALSPAREAEEFPLRASFGDGVTFSTPDEDFVLRLRLMAQSDAKLFLPSDQDPARSGVYLPRIRTYFEGQATRSFGYEVSIQRSVEGTFDVLDANVNYRPADAFQIKFGRFLVPYSYDWYDHLEQFFITPERGLFPLNFGLSRSAGGMVWGNALDDRVGYAVGGFSGQLAGLADTNQTRDLVGYLNVRPFRQGGVDALRFLNVGGSVAVGHQSYAAAPLPLRTAVQSSDNDEAARGASAVFLDFFEEVVASGDRQQAAAHVALYAGGWSVEAEAQAGRFDYRNADGERVRLPVSGAHLAVSYFVTGEKVEGRTTVVPLRPFDPAGGRWGPGAIEPFVRVSHLRLGDEVFAGRLASAEEWTDRATAVDVGWNWYPNRFVKFYLDWQHTAFGKPILINAQTRRYSKSDDLLWLRAQLCY